MCAHGRAFKSLHRPSVYFVVVMWEDYFVCVFVLELNLLAVKVRRDKNCAEFQILVCWVSLLLVCVLYVCALMCVHLVGQPNQSPGL